MAGTEVQTLVAELILDTSKAQSALRDLSRKLSAFGAGDAGASAAGSKAGKSWVDAFNKGVKSNRITDIGLAGLGGGLKFLRNTVLATAAAGTVLELSFMNVQKSQAALARTLYGESAPAVAKLSAQILEISKTVPIAVTELYRIAEVIGTTNVAADNIDELTEVVAKLAATTDLSADEAAIGMARLLNMFGRIDSEGHIAAGAAKSLASEIVTASLAFASSDQEILRAALRFGALASSMKMTEAQVLALSGAVTGLGQEPEAVGGSFQRMFQIINKAVGATDKDLKAAKKAGASTAEAWAAISKTKAPLVEFAKLAGMSAEQFDKAWKTKPYDTLLALERGFAKLSPTAQATLFGEGGIFPSFVRGMQTIQNLGVVEKLGQIGVEYAKIVEAGKRGTAIDEQFAVATDTLQAKLQLLANALVRGSVAFGAAFNDELGDAILNITKLIDDNMGKFEEWGQKVGAAIKSINWQEVKQFASDFFGIFATGVKATGAVLDLLGPRLTGFLAIWKTIDMLSGGAVSNILKLTASGVGGVIKFAFDQTFGRGSPTNPMWVRMIGGIGAPGAAKGVITSFLGALSIAAFAAAIGLAIIEAFKAGAQPAVDELNQKVDRLAQLSSGSTAIDAISNLSQVMGDLVHSNDLAANVQNIAKLWVSGGLDTVTRAYREAAANVIADPNLGRSEIIRAMAAMSEAIKSGNVPDEAIPDLTKAIEALRVRLRVLVGDNTREPRPSVLGLEQRTSDFRAAHDAHEAHLDATQGHSIMEAGFSSVAGKLTDLIDALKPRHRAGEKGKSIQSAEFAALNRLDPSRTGDINAYLSDLIAHYKKQPIGTKGHERGFIMPAFKGIFPELKADLKAAMKTGGPGLDKLLENLKGLKHLGVRLPPGLLRLIEKAHKEENRGKDLVPEVKKVKSAVTDAGDRIENLTAALRRKRLSVRVAGAKVNVHPGRVTVGATVVKVTVGTRNITRVVRSHTAYGPSLVFQQPGAIWEGPN